MPSRSATSPSGPTTFVASGTRATTGWTRTCEIYRRRRTMQASSSTTFTTPTDREVVATRTFDAPRELVWDAFTKPEHLQQWLLGPDGWEMPICEVDLRPGGAYRYGWAEAGTGANQFELSGTL